MFYACHLNLIFIISGISNVIAVLDKLRGETGFALSTVFDSFSSRKPSLPRHIGTSLLSTAVQCAPSGASVDGAVSRR